MEIAFLIGRILVGGFFVMNGLNHFAKGADLRAYAAMKKVPAPGLAVPATGLLLLAGGLSVLLGFEPRVGSVLLVVFLVPTAFLMHNFWAVEDPQMRMVEMAQFMKNLALAGSALMFLLLPTPWPFSL